MIQLVVLKWLSERLIARRQHSEHAGMLCLRRAARLPSAAIGQVAAFAWLPQPAAAAQICCIAGAAGAAAALVPLRRPAAALCRAARLLVQHWLDAAELVALRCCIQRSPRVRLLLQGRTHSKRNAIRCACTRLRRLLCRALDRSNSGRDGGGSICSRRGSGSCICYVCGSGSSGSGSLPLPRRLDELVEAIIAAACKSAQPVVSAWAGTSRSILISNLASLPVWPHC